MGIMAMMSQKRTLWITPGRDCCHQKIRWYHLFRRVYSILEHFETLRLSLPRTTRICCLSSNLPFDNPELQILMYFLDSPSFYALAQSLPSQLRKRMDMLDCSCVSVFMGLRHHFCSSISGLSVTHIIGVCTSAKQFLNSQQVLV